VQSQVAHLGRSRAISSDHALSFYHASGQIPSDKTVLHIKSHVMIVALETYIQGQPSADFLRGSRLLGSTGSRITILHNELRYVATAIFLVAFRAASISGKFFIGSRRRIPPRVDLCSSSSLERTDTVKVLDISLTLYLRKPILHTKPALLGLSVTDLT